MDWHIPAEQIRQALSRSPRPIREFIIEGELTQAIGKITQEYQLHVDTTGSLVQLMNAVLLGFIGPASLPIELAKIGVPKDRVSAFINELNVQIFVPLQKRVREGGEEPTKEERVQAAKPDPQSVPPTTSERPASFRTVSPAPSIPMPALSAPSVVMPPEIHADPQAPSFNLTASALNMPTIPTPPAANQAPVPTMRTMQHDIDALSHGSIPAPYPTAISSMPPAPHPSQMTPASEFQTASVPYTSMPLPSRPAPQPVQPPVQVPEAIQLSQLPTPAVAASNSVPSSDPYRESI